MIEWFEKLDHKLQVVIISSLTSNFVFIIGWFFKISYERNSVSFIKKSKLEKEMKSILNKIK